MLLAILAEPPGFRPRFGLPNIKLIYIFYSKGNYPVENFLAEEAIACQASPSSKLPQTHF